MTGTYDGVFSFAASLYSQLEDQLLQKSAKMLKLSCTQISNQPKTKQRSSVFLKVCLEFYRTMIFLNSLMNSLIC